MHRDRDGVAVGQVAHVDGPLHQLAGGGLPVLAPIVVPLDQILAVGVEPLQVQHPVGAAHRHLHIRVDLDAQGAVGGVVGLVIPKEHQAEAGGRGGQPGQRLPQGGGLGLRLPELHDGLDGIPHLVVQVGRLEEPALLVQHHRVGGVGLHN